MKFYLIYAFRQFYNSFKQNFIIKNFLKPKLLLFILFLLTAVLYSLYFGVAPVKIEKACPRNFTEIVQDSQFKSIYSKIFMGCSLKNGVSLKPFYTSGTGHLLTISGLHVASLVFSIYFLLNILLRLFLKKHIPLFYFSLPMSLLVSFLYIFFIGLEVPRLRSLLMISFFAFSFLLPIFKNRLFLILSSMIIILFLFPNSIYSGSFYFSYMAVFAIYLSNGVKQFKSIYVPLIIFVFLTPLNLYFSGQINFLHILANIIFVPVFSLFYYPFVLLFLPLSILLKNTMFLDAVSYLFYSAIRGFSYLSAKTNLFISYLKLSELFIVYLVLFLVFIFFETYNLTTLIILGLFMFFVLILNTVWYGI